MISLIGSARLALYGLTTLSMPTLVTARAVPPAM